MKARDIDTAMSVMGALVTLALIILKGFGKLALETNDCFVAGLMIACCTKFIAVARLVGVLKSDPTAFDKEPGGG
jgi:uncharacterized membrane protein